MDKQLCNCERPLFNEHGDCDSCRGRRFANFKRVVRPGTVELWEGKRASLFVCIEYKSGKLSLTAVEGPKANGDCLGSCGQADSGLVSESFSPGDGWTRDMATQLWQYWQDWHLNDMRPYSLAMKAEGWHHKAALAMAGYRFTLESSVSDNQRRIKESANGRLLAGERVQYSKAELSELARPYDLMIWQYADDLPPATPSGYKAGDYKGERLKESKTLGWLYPMESQSITKPDCHIDGLLTKVLPATGESYGGKWYQHEVPSDVLAWLAALPAYNGRLGWFNWQGDLAAFSIGDKVLLHSQTPGTVERISEANQQLILRLDDGRDSVCYPGDCKQA
jgi:hypothetical protein